MWSETVSLRTRPVSDQKNRSLSWRSDDVFWNTDLLRSYIIIMILKDRATLQVLFIVYLLCAGNITKNLLSGINSGVYLHKS